jgi:hypothetical protein
MHVVTAEVTVVVSGVIAVGVCANATPAANIPDESAADTANTMVPRRIVASRIALRMICQISLPAATTKATILTRRG